jgi:hypothetical protein
MALTGSEKARFATALTNGEAAFTSADAANTLHAAANAKQVIAAGAYGTLIDNLVLYSNDTVQRTAYVYLYDGANVQLFLSINVPPNSGTDGSTAAVDCLNNSNSPFQPINNQGKRYLRLKAGQSIYVGFSAQLTSGKVAYARAAGLDYVD